MEDYTKQDEAYRAYKKGLEAGKPKWIPVTEPPKKPDIYQVVIYDKDFHRTKVWYGQWSGYDWFVYDIYGDGIRCEVTHWMPMTELPKGE